MQSKNAAEPLEFLKSNNFLRTWKTCQGSACTMEQVALSLDRAPPPETFHSVEPVLETRSVKEVPKRREKLTEADKWMNLLEAGLAAANAVSSFSDWIKQPPAKPEPRIAPAPLPPAAASRQVPPFDIQDVPKAMRKLGMPISAALQERWFAGQANYSRTTGDLRNEVNQHGARYSAGMVDTTTIKMSWVLSFARAQAAFDELVKERVRNQSALEILRRKLLPFFSGSHDLVAAREAKGDLLAFHQMFQFQLIPVNASWGARIASFLERSLSAGGVPDDLTGALGAFNIHAAVEHATFNRAAKIAFVRRLSIYVRDSYEFSDEQYLGHWSSNHVAVVPAHQVAGGEGWLQYPVVHDDLYNKGGVLYPVTNRDYRDWRTRHRRGGDFVIYSDRISVSLVPPIQVSMP